MSAVRASPELVALGKDGRDQERFTSRDMIAVEARLERAGDELGARAEHGVADRHRSQAIGAAEARGFALSGEQRDAFDHITGGEGLAAVVGYAGTGKSAMLGVAREAWEGQGYTVRGRHQSGRRPQGFREKPGKTGGVCLQRSASGRAGRRYPKARPSIRHVGVCDHTGSNRPANSRWS
ncbi:AAA family ATPase [Sphingomonas sp. LK11]|uniref:AAA family ATPase n=1 Tax=Sphingomonas sp. LK11 TaxID=1390395 RepID=UPI001F36672B|nr:AAA family ATPase [Sphingomonas sp. LK11]